MGLDNGICIKRKSASKDALILFDKPWKAIHEYDLDIAYWRKCWNVRSVIMDALNIYEDNDSQTAMTIDDVILVIHKLKQFKRENYYKWGGTIWEWSDFKRINRKNIKALHTLVKLMQRDPNIEVYFYDSW